jgi:DNA-binding beta-propeller fold protein YncE
MQRHFIMNYFLGILAFACVAACQNKPLENKPKVSILEKENKEICKTSGTFSELVLERRIHSIDPLIKEEKDVYDLDIYSPKSAIYSKDGTKFYVNSLEGYATVVYDANSFKKIKTIKHHFSDKNKHLFKNNENTAFNYQFKQKKDNFNHFFGKPVESCLSHEGKFLWVTFYRRDFDENAESPSAVAIINTETDEISRVIPSGPLPKMIACSPDNKFISVTHWGDNTVGIIDISSNNVMDFKYVSHIEVDGRLTMNYANGQKVNRDNDCGNCLRGTVFSPDGKYIFIAKMGGNGIAVIETKTFKYIGTITGSKGNLRHIIINNDDLILSSNKHGVVQKAKLSELLDLPFENEKTLVNYPNWQTVNVGFGARTIEATTDGKYIFACVNNECKVVVIDTQEMKVIASKDVSKFPVGMAISHDGTQLIVTSQGKDSVLKSGNAVSIFKIKYE